MNELNFIKIIKLITLSITVSILISGCATINEPDPRDPWESMNRGTQVFNDGLDDYLIAPVARGYVWLMPSFASTGVTNFFNNIRDIRVTINDVLQLKFKQGGMDAGRFLINSTAGIGGFIDVATMVDLPRHDEDFDQTLGYWGVPQGPYLVLPLFGPSSVRGLTGLVGDAAMNPLTYSFFLGDSLAISLGSLGLYTVDVIDRRANVLGLEQVAVESGDPYEFYRDSYIQQRESLVKDGEVPDIADEFDFEEEEIGDLPAP